MRALIVLISAMCVLSAQPARIVSTSPSVTETLFALGLGAKVVAVSQHCHYPPEVNSRPRVGPYLRPNVEAIVGLRPDLVIVQADATDAISQLKRMKLNVLAVDHGDLATTFAGIRAIGDRCGVRDRAAQLDRDIRARLAAIRRRTGALPRRSLIFIVGRTPGRLEGLIAVGKGSYLNELIEIAGGVNALASTPLPYPKLSLEAMLGLNPDVLVDMGEMAETTGVTDERKRSVVELWNSHPALRAVQLKRVFAVASDIFVVPGPRIAEAAEAFEKMLHPEAAR